MHLPATEIRSIKNHIEMFFTEKPEKLCKDGSLKLRESMKYMKLIEDTKDSMEKLAAGGLRSATKKMRMQRKKRRACMGFTSNLRKQDISNYISNKVPDKIVSCRYVSYISTNECVHGW